MTEYDAYVYDLDGTLVDLAVDWDTVARDVAEVLAARGLDVTEVDLWGMLQLAEETGHREVVEETIGAHERAGARNATRLGLADRLPHAGPVGVCSLNCEAAARLALERYDLATAVDVVVGRDSHEHEKPHPGPLLATVEALGTDPGRTVFVGDSPRDEETAERAGTPFVYASEW